MSDPKKRKPLSQSRSDSTQSKDYTSWMNPKSSKELAEKLNIEIAGELIKKIRNLTEKQLRIENDLNYIKTDVEKSLENKQIKIIEGLGIFVALFTFISIEFQIFKIYTHPYSIIGITFIFLGSLLILISVLDFLLNLNKDSSDNKYKYISVACCFIFFIPTIKNMKQQATVIYLYFLLNLNKDSSDNKYKYITVACCFIFLIVGINFLCFSPEKQNLEKMLEKVNQLNEYESNLSTLQSNLKNIEDKQNIQQQYIEKESPILQCLKYKGRFTPDCFKE